MAPCTRAQASGVSRRITAQSQAVEEAVEAPASPRDFPDLGSGYVRAIARLIERGAQSSRRSLGGAGPLPRPAPQLSATPARQGSWAPVAPQVPPKTPWQWGHSVCVQVAPLCSERPRLARPVLGPVVVTVAVPASPPPPARQATPLPGWASPRLPRGGSASLPAGPAALGPQGSWAVGAGAGQRSSGPLATSPFGGHVAAPPVMRRPMRPTTRRSFVT